MSHPMSEFFPQAAADADRAILIRQGSPPPAGRSRVRENCARADWQDGVLGHGRREKSIHAPAVTRRVMALGVERHPRRTRRRADATVGTARTATVVPYDDPFAGLVHEAVALASGAAGAVIHAVAALPLRLLRALKNVRCPEVRREQAELEPRAGDAVRHLGRVVGCPPDFIRAGRRRIVGTVATRDAGAQAGMVARCVWAQTLWNVHIVVIATIKNAGDANLLEIAKAFCLACLSFGTGESGQKQRGENGENGNDHQ